MNTTIVLLPARDNEKSISRPDWSGRVKEGNGSPGAGPVFLLVVVVITALSRKKVGDTSSRNGRTDPAIPGQLPEEHCQLRAVARISGR
jgi:hypothetical protein